MENHSVHPRLVSILPHINSQSKLQTAIVKTGAFWEILQQRGKSSNIPKDSQERSQTNTKPGEETHSDQCVMTALTDDFAIISLLQTQHAGIKKVQAT